MHDAVELFQRALTLEAGGRIVIPCQDYYEMERVRVALYKQLNRLRRANRKLAEKLSISREFSSENAKFMVYISHSAFIRDAFVELPDGSIKELVMPKPETELDRICALMKEEGHTDEEIKEYREDYTTTMLQGD